MSNEDKKRAKYNQSVHDHIFGMKCLSPYLEELLPPFEEEELIAEEVLGENYSAGEMGNDVLAQEVE